METPRFELSKSKAIEQYKKVQGLADIVSYSSKTNQEITKILEKETDCLFSVHFEKELKHVKNKARVLFLAQGWNNNQIKKLTEQGINRFVVDNERDLDELLEFLRCNKASVSLLLRAKLREQTIKTERYFVFGMDSATINKRIREIRNDKALEGKIKVLGIHFHKKTQNLSEWNLQFELEQLLEKEVLEKIDLVNMGGGLPSEYANTNMDVLPSIFEKILSFKKWLNEKGKKLMIEPGRFIAAPSCRLVTKIIRVYENTVVVDASVYNSDLDAVIVPVKLMVENELEKGKGKPFVIKGATPCSMDLFRYRVYLDEPKEGEEIVFLNAGAYNFTTDFCDLERIKTIIVN